jgi:Polysaccharide lyase/RTX calcium-binding nonapeptide repeat (4 copies)
MIILPSQWTPNTRDSDMFVLDNRQWVVDAEKSWSFSSPDNNTLRFEVRKGDQFSDSAWTDPRGVERAEINDTARYSTSQEIGVAYQFMIEPGPQNTARWLVMGQLHSNTNGSPPIEIKLEGNDKMVIYGNYQSSSGNLVYQKLFQDAQNLVRGKWYTMKLDVKIDAYGSGHVNVWRDGQQIIDYDGRLGYQGQTQTYWREGIYRSSPSGGETIAINYKNLDIEVGPNAHNVSSGPLVPSPGPVTNPNPAPNPTVTWNGEKFVGGWADNTINGTSGNNMLYGKAGNDTLTGGAGRDAFVFDTQPGSTNRDRIMDFAVNDDTIVLENAVFTSLAAGALSGSAFWVGSRAHDADDRIVYDSASGALHYDADGSGAGAGVQIATLSTGLKMASANVYVI